MKSLHFETKINAPKAKVWDTMLSHGPYEEWVGAGWPGSTYEGEWKKGARIRFFGKDESGADAGGTVAEVVDIKLHEFVLAEHVAALLAGGKEDTESDLAKGWIGTKENYYFTEESGVTALRVEIKTYPAWASMFQDGWPKALAKLKKLSEMR
jgi:uncharacterized protein YndB with AHSA1/START domain